MLVKVTKTTGFTKRVLAHDGRANLLVSDREGVQDVPDHPRVHQLISDGVLEKASQPKSEPTAPETTEPEPDTVDEATETTEETEKEPEPKPAPRRRNARKN